MSTSNDPLRKLLYDEALRTEMRPDEVFRHHLLEGIACRVAQVDSADPALLLRGSLALRLWIRDTPRRAQDIDFIATFPHSLQRVEQIVRQALALDLEDGISFDLDRFRARAIWAESLFPGVRLSIRALLFGRSLAVTSDVGFGDPLVPPPAVVNTLSSAQIPLAIPAVHPVTLAAWKLHGLVEWGPRWRPKDWLDLWLLSEILAQAEPATVAAALTAAFESRGCRALAAREAICDPLWASPVASDRWDRFCEALPRGVSPGPLHLVRSRVQDRLHPALSLLSPPGNP